MTATDHPQLVKTLILLAAGGMVEPAPEIARASAGVLDSGLPRDVRLTAITRTLFASGHDGAVWEQGWYFDVAKAQGAANAATPLQEWWAGGSAPILVLQAVEDVIAVPENAQALAKEYPNRVAVVEIPHAGHAMLPEQPERIATEIVAYLKR